jgi:hypothetical protein
VLARGKRQGTHANQVRVGTRQPRRIAVSVMVAFDPDQSEWLSQEAERTGQDYDEIVKRLVDVQRTGSAGSK